MTDPLGTKTETRKRVPFSANRKRLQIDEKFEGFATRWFNDQDDRLARAEAAGYRYVDRKEVRGVGEADITNGNTDLNSKVSRVVGRTQQNTPIRAFLMKIRLEFKQEDDRAKEAKNALVDEAIRGGKPGGIAMEKQYGEIKLG